jgi:ribosomal protein S3
MPAGEKGRRIRELTSAVQKRFNFPKDTVELYAEKVANRGLCAVAQAESLRYKLLGGLAVRRWGRAQGCSCWRAGGHWSGAGCGLEV